MLVAENQVSPVQHFKLTAGERAQAEFVFGEGLPIQEGSVVDALNGAPLHGAEVIAEWPELAVPSTVTTRSNSKGRFSFYGLRPPTRVSVRREGYANATLSVTGLDAPRIALQPAGSLAVNVVGPGGTPRWATGVALVGPHPLSWTLPGGAWKGVTSQEGTRWRTSAVTDVEGRARFSALAAGTWEVSGAAFAPRRVIVTAGRETQLDIQLD
jgi:hypothetical protein